MSGGPFYLGQAQKNPPAWAEGLAHTIVVSEVSAIRYK